ncbi:hypothetical protein BsWGS_15089 [Bradybaena similaris]
MNNSESGAFCEDSFWEPSLLLNNTWPQFTSCFISTILVWVPCGYMWLLLPYFLYDVNNEFSTNNLRPRNVVSRQIQRPAKAPQGNMANGGPQSPTKETTTGALTPICVFKLILSLLLAVLSLIELLFKLRDHRPTSHIVAWSIYLATYMLTAFQVWYERRKARQPMMMTFYFYTLNTVLGIIPVYSWFKTQDYLLYPTEFGIHIVTVFVNLLCFLLSFASDNSWLPGGARYEVLGMKQCPEVFASYPSRIFFFWLTKLIITGFKKEITAGDLWELHPRDQGSRLNPIFEKHWKQEQQKVEQINSARFFMRSNSRQASRSGWARRKDSVYYEGVHERTSLLITEDIKIGASETPSTEKQPTTASVMMPLIKLTWSNAITSFVEKIFADIFVFMGPILLGALIEKLQYPDKEKEWQAYVLSLGLMLTGLMRSVLFTHSMNRSALMAMHVKTTLVGAIYKKALTISSYAKRGSTVGEIVNLMSVDCQRLQEILTFYTFLWSTPIQCIFAIALLYNTIGISVLTGVALLVLLVPFNAWIANQQKQYQEENLVLKDARIKMVNEILNGMKVLKLYAWEDQFKRKVEQIREDEMKQLRLVAILYILAGVLWGMAPFLVGFLTFATYLLSDRNNVLDPQKAFVCLSLFNLLKVPLYFISTLLTYTVQINVSIKRLDNFLTKEDLDESNTKWDVNAEHGVFIGNGTFTWDPDLKPTLRNINLTVAVGQLTAIVGPVGSGKSSVISAILGDMEKVQGQVVVKGTVAYVSQQAWIQNATVRDNILFGKKFNRRKYAQVIKACELERDLTILEAGDQTEIGEKGINLSGGQKQRVSLARAVYSDADIFLFDDPLSAVDAHVGKAIFKNVVGRSGVLATKTRVLVTHGVHWLPQVDDIVVLYNGAISEHGSYAELLSHNGPFAQFLQVYLTTPSNVAQEDSSSEDDPEIQVVKHEMRSIVERVTSDTANTSADEFSSNYSPIVYMPRRTKPHSKVYERSTSTPILIQESLDMSMGITTSVRSVHPVGGKLILEEKLETGKVKRDVFVVYGRAAGMAAMMFAFMMYAVNQGLIVWSSFFLTDWTMDPVLLNASTRATPDGASASDYYLIIYGVFFGGTQLVTLLLFSYVFWYRSVRAADRMHHLLLDRLFHAPMSFFDQTPIGRILNRFSKDVDTIDNTLPLILRDWLITFSIIIITVVVVLIKSPIFGAVLVPICIVFYVIQNYYVRTSRQLKRIESVTRSPIYMHFSESITGAAVIRSYRAVDRFIHESEQRVDKNQIYFFASQSAIRWLQLSMDLLANAVVLFAAIFQITSGGGGSDAGLSVSYALQISSCLAYMVRQVSEFETNIVSVERLKEYSQVDQEAALINPLKRPAPHWPNRGNVIFTDYKTRYRQGLDLVLKGVTCHISGGEKIGIVGRTGAGKSSLTVSLFRIIEAVGGSISIDGINIADIGLHDLRSKLTILPQDPVIFSGSLQMNIDPFEQYTDQQLWTALERSYLKEFVAAQPDKLMYECGEEGANLSIGQRQLVCLARSLLRHTKILILDEATAAIDMETDALIQKTIREAFKDCTIIAIAHRLNTIMDYDKIMVMDAGVISEFDTPANLINSKGIFYGMCKDAGLV